MGIRWSKLYAADPFSGGSDARLAFNPRSILEFRAKVHVGSGRWIDDAFDSKNLGREPHGFCKIARNAGHRRQKQVSETVIVQPAFAIEPESKQPRHEMLVFRESDHAVSNVAGGQNV